MSECPANATANASDCPNCLTNKDEQTDCPHLLAGDECPECGHELHKPTSGKVECERCMYVVNGRAMNASLRDFNLTVRQGQRLLKVFGEEPYASPGNIENALRRICEEHCIDRYELNDFLNDLCRKGDYTNE